MRATFIALFLACVFDLSAAEQNTAAPAAPPESTGKADAAGSVYVLQPQDLIKVQIFQEPDLDRELRISQEATVSLPLIGNVELGRTTIRQAEERIRQLYDAGYLVKPQVNITVLEYSPRSVDVVGAVMTPGVILFPKEEGMTLLGAISRAGSFSRLANRKQVTLKRTLPNGEVLTERINVDDLMKGDTSKTWPLQPGDVITVPEKIL